MLTTEAPREDEGTEKREILMGRRCDGLSKRAAQSRRAARESKSKKRVGTGGFGG